MPLGPGKYDDLCTLVRARSKARAALIIVIGGEHGPGFSMQGALSDVLGVPTMLRSVADEIERSQREGKI